MYSRQSVHLCVRLSITSRSRSGTAKPQQGLNGLHFSVVISTYWWWVIASMYDLSSPMYFHILGVSHPHTTHVAYSNFEALLLFTYRFCLTS
jgi:hypothetical protein